MAIPVSFKRRQEPPLEQNDSLIRSLGQGTIGGLQYVGETLNKPSRALWGSLNAITGGDAGGGLLNLIPFSDAMGLTDPIKGIELDKFLENQGVLPENEEGFDRYDPLRFAAQVIGDPTTYLSFGGAALGKGGQVLKKAGGLKGISRVGRITQNVADESAGIAPEALGQAAKASGYADTGAFLAERGAEKAGGLVGIGLPFRQPSFAVGTGPTAQKIGGALDSLGEAARYGKIPGTQFSPGQHLARAFSAPAMGLHTPEVGKATAGLADQRDLISAGVRKNVARDALRLYREGHLDDEASTLGRMYAEGVLDETKLTPEQITKAKAVSKVIEPYKQKFDEILQQARQLGVRVEAFGDPAGIAYWPREFVDMIQNYAHGMPREDYLRGIIGGTEKLRQIIADPKLLEGSIEDAKSYLVSQYGDDFKRFMPRAEYKNGLTSIDPEKYAKASADASHMLDQLVDRIRNVYTPEQRAVGGFGRNVLLDAQDALTGMQWKMARAGSMLEQLKNFAKPIQELDAVGGPRLSVGEILQQADLDPVANFSEKLQGAGHMGQKVERKGGALHMLAEAMGLPRTDASLDAISKMELPAAIGEDLIRLVKGDDIKTAVGPWLKAMDSFTNLFKVGVLNWPARYVRDFTSGQAMNMITGNWSPQAFAEAQRLIAGGVSDFTDIPIVQRMLAEQGLEATAENSTDVMRQLIYGHDVFTGQHGAQGAGEVVGGGTVPGRSSSFAREFIGNDPLSPLKPQTLVGGNTWNPLSLRGVGDNLETGNYLAASGERAGKYTDGMNRIVPFIHNLRRGVDPGQAKQLVDALQVNYSPASFTAAEKKYLKRAFPFYAFQRKMTEDIVKQLLDRPGGGIGQTIRAANEMHGDLEGPAPEEVTRGLSIPLGETSDGSQRYLTGAGLMHESAFEGLSATGSVPNLGSTIAELGSKLNPLLKWPIEAGTGVSLFQQRKLEDLDPALGRTLSNVGDLAENLTGSRLGLRDTFSSGRAQPVISPQFENLVMNTPASRALTTARTLTDKRKYEGGLFPGSAALLNLGTGLRVTDVSPQVQEGILRDAIAQASKERGATRFETIRFSKADIEEAKKEDPELAAEMEALNREQSRMVQKAKIRRKQAAKN